MSKQKPLPPQQSPKPVRNENPVTRPWATPLAPSPLVKFEHRAVFCQADEVAFGALATTMERDGWELVSTESCQRHVNTANGAGMSQGWMTFWKRVKKEAAS